MTARLRLADPERDAAAVAAIYAPNVTHGTASFEEVAPDAAEMGRRIAGLGARYPFLVAERDGVVAGYAYGAPFNDRAAYRWAATVTVYVHPDHVRRGVARGLYAALVPLLKTQGLWQLGAIITGDNAPSVALHEAFGFRRAVRYPDVGFKFGRWIEVGWWMLALRTPTDPTETPAEPLTLPELCARPGFPAALAGGAGLIS